MTFKPGGSMSPFAIGIIPVDLPAPKPAVASRDLFEQLGAAFTAEQLDVAIDRAARSARGTVAAYAAAPVDCWDEREGQAAVEVVVEFFVPPLLGSFYRELEAQLLLASPRYAAGRDGGDFRPCVLHSIGAGTFHQHRVTIGMSAPEQCAGRWSGDRALIEAILHQSRTGWREVGLA
jgi:hypothetical protein